MDIKCFHALDENLKKIWISLEDKVPCTPFQTYAYNSFWLENFTKKKVEIKIFVIKINSIVVAIIPLQIERKLSISFVEYIATAQADYTGALIDIENINDFYINEIWLHIQSVIGKRAIYYFKKIPSDISILNSGLPEYFKKISGFKCHAICFDQKYIIKNLSDVRRQIKRLRFGGQLTFKRVNPLSLDFDNYFSEFVKLKNTRLISQNKTILFKEDCLKSFYRSLLTQSKIFKMHALVFNSTIVAMNLGAYYKNRYFYLIPAYRMGYMSYSWGSILINFLIKYSKKLRLNYFDMTIGDEPYKKKYSNTNFYADYYFHSSIWFGIFFYFYILFYYKTKNFLQNFIRHNSI
jgi:CelD/BcsL family acetyltransferase involved in cellulose biosynthesis